MRCFGCIIKSHNTTISKTSTTETDACNCLNKRKCPINGNCQTPSVVYKCEVTAPNLSTEVYIGLTEKPFKTRFNSYTQSMRNAKYKKTLLSTYVWSLNDNGIIPALKWSIVNTARTYTNGSRNCPLCLRK